jgi:hypothetical protein
VVVVVLDSVVVLEVAVAIAVITEYGQWSQPAQNH